jgi:hypothetical protein
MFPQRLLVLPTLAAVVACSAPPQATNIQPEGSPRVVVHQKRLELAAPERVIPAVQRQPGASVPGDAVATAPRPEQLALLWRLERGFGSVLKRGDVATRGAARKLPMSTSPGDFLLEKDVEPAALGEFGALRGRVFDLYGRGGIECSATVTSFRAVGGFTSWDEEESADSVWEQLPEHYLVAVLEPTDTTCKPLWARAHDLPKPSVLRARPLTAVETRQATRALATTAVARSLQTEYARHREDSREPYGPATWDALEPREWRALAFEHPQHATTYVTAELSAGEGCGDFGGYALGFFKTGSPTWLDVTGDGSPEFPDHPLFGLAPSAAVLLESGGPVYFIHPDALYANTGAGVVPLATIGRVGTTCGC